MTRQEHLERTLRNIIAIGDEQGSPAHRMLKMLKAAEGALDALKWRSFDGDINVNVGGDQ